MFQSIQLIIFHSNVDSAVFEYMSKTSFGNSADIFRYVEFMHLIWTSWVCTVNGGRHILHGTSGPAASNHCDHLE